MELALGDSVRSRIESRVNKRARPPAHAESLGHCWEWIGCKNSAGYGQIRVDGKAVYTHRAMYELTVGPIQDGRFVLHRCDNPVCCRPEHLTIGTAKDNLDDCQRKGRRRFARGDGSNAVLTEEQVRYVRESQDSSRCLATELGVHHSAVWAARCGKTWAHVPDAKPRRRAKKLNREQVLEVRARVANGETQASVAGSLGITKSAVGCIVRGKTWAGIGVLEDRRVSRRKVTRPIALKMRAMREQGLSLKKIGEAFAVSAGTVANNLREAT